MILSDKVKFENISLMLVSADEERGNPMNIGLQHYVPCLRWKQGEYQALFRLSPNIKGALVPLIEVSEIGYDFETRMENKTIDEHLSAFPKRVKDKWGTRPCLVDMHLIEASQRMDNGEHPFTFVFNDLRLKGVAAIPVVRLEQDSACQDAIESIVAQDKIGLCFRINVENAAKANIMLSLKTLLQRYNQEVETCDFILDLGAPNFEPIEGFVEVLGAIITDLPHREEWRSFSIIGTAFPSSMAEVERGLSIKPRNEWKLYKYLVNRLQALDIRIPTFGDYAINHPDLLPLDFRIVKPSASVRYTIDDNWLIAKGSNVREYGMGQYRELCKSVINSQYYFGQNYSMGDRYIYDCAQGTASTGNLSTWRWVGTNHHLTKVVHDVANLFGS